MLPNEMANVIKEIWYLSILSQLLLARVATKEERVGTINGVPVYRTTYTEVEGLPEPEPGTVYIVSLLVLQALQARRVQRSDVVAPNTSPTPNGAVRDAQGRIVGVRSFVVL